MELSGDISDTDNEFGSISRIQRIQLRRSQIQRDKIRRLLFDSSSEDESESESPGGSTNPEPIVQFPNVTPSDEKSVLENSGSCNMVLISIDGLDGKDPFLACNGLELPGPVRRFSFKPGRIVGADATDEGIRGVATELLELGMESINIMHSQEPVDTALVFIASDLGGSVLKQALVEASQNPKYSQVLQSTALLIFFGTPHRSHPSCQWNHMLLELLYKQSTSLLGSWIPAQIQRLSAFHEVLATNFSTFLRSNTLDILSFYQEELEPNIYDILIPKNAAILDDPREIAIGLHRPHAHLGKFYTPEDQRFLISKLSDAKIRRRAEYKLFLCVLSKYGLSVPVRQHSSPIYKSLCDWFIEDDSFLPWLGITTSSESPSQYRSVPIQPHKREKSPSSRIIMALELDGAIERTEVLTSSLIASIRSRRMKAKDQFVTLAHHHPQPQPLTKVQLLASLCGQILNINPCLYDRIHPFFSCVHKAVYGHNTVWTEAILWRILRVLLNGNTLGQTFIIIHQPLDTVLGAPFERLLDDIIAFTESTEIHYKILVVTNSSTTNPRNCNSLPKSISYQNPAVQAALEKDFTRELNIISQTNPHCMGMEHEAIHLLLKKTADLHLSQLFLVILAQHTVALTSLKKVLPITSNNDLAPLIADLIPRAFQSWVRTGLVWITHAVRPLARSEFEEVLALSMALDDNIQSPVNSVDEVLRLLHGIVEMERDVVYVNYPELCLQVLDCMWKQKEHINLEKHEQNPDYNPQNQDHRSQYQPDAHLGIAQTCLAYLVKHQNFCNQKADKDPRISFELESGDLTDTQQGNFSNSRGTYTKPLLQYAVDHWFTHLKLSQNKENLAEITPIASFLADKNRVSLWMKWRVRYRTVDQPFLDQSTFPGLDVLANMLAFRTSNALDMLQTVDIALNSSDIGNVNGSGLWFPVVLTASQMGDIGILHKLDDKGCLEDDFTLGAVFETGSEEVLCDLVSRKSHWIRQNIHKVIQDAIAIKNLGLVHKLQTEFGASISFENDQIPLIYGVAEDGATLPSDSIWKELKTQVDVKFGGRNVLHTAACSGHYALIPRLLSILSELELSINSQDSLGLSPLHLAAENGHLAVIKQLLAAGANVNLPDKGGQTPLHIASAGGYADVVRILLQSGADISLKDKQFRNPLHLALKYGHRGVPTVLFNELLLFPEKRESVDLDGRDSEGWTPLLLAVKGNSPEAVKNLLYLGASINLPSFKQSSPLHYAAEFGFYEVLIELMSVEDVEVNARDEDSNTPIHLATNWDHIHVIRKLLEHGADCSTTNSEDRTPLAIACREGHMAAAAMLLQTTPRKYLDNAFYCASSSSSVETLRLMLNSGVDMNINRKPLGTSLHIASYNSKPRFVELLLTRYADLKQRDKDGRTPLMDAVRQNASECVRLLVNAGADLEAKDIYGCTSLFYAASSGYQTCVRILLDANAKLNIPESMSDQYRKPVDLALSKFESEVFEMIVEKISHQPSPPGTSGLSPSPDVLRKCIIDNGYNKNIQILLKKATDWNLNQDIGMLGTMLHYATFWGRKDLVRLLIESDRVDINVCNEARGTPLEIAATKVERPACTEIVEFLLDKGANTTIGSAYYGTPLHAAAYMPNGYESGEKYLAIAKKILNHDPSIINKKAGYFGTPLNSALVGGTTSIIETLLGYSPELSIQSGSLGTALHYAARHGRIQSIDSLLNMKMNPGITDTGGRLPIHMAAIGGHTFIIDKLTTLETTLLTTDFEGRHSLHFAVTKDSLHFVREILDRYPGAINHTDCDGWTPLHWACRQSSRVIRCLLERGANKHIKTNRGWQAVHVAIYHDRESDIIDLVKTDTFEETQNELYLPGNSNTFEEESLPVRKERFASTNGSSSYYCDSCSCTIYGPRHCCKCHGFDLCFKCHRLGKKHLFKGHDFELWTSSGEGPMAVE